MQHGTAGKYAEKPAEVMDASRIPVAGIFGNCGLGGIVPG